MTTRIEEKIAAAKEALQGNEMLQRGLEAVKAAMQNAEKTMQAVKEENNQMKEAKQEMRNKIQVAVGTEDQAAVEKIVEAVETGSYAAVEDAVKAAVEEKEEEKMTARERFEAKKAQMRKALDKGEFGIGYGLKTAQLETAGVCKKAISKIAATRDIQNIVAGAAKAKEDYAVREENRAAEKAAKAMMQEAMEEAANC